MIEIFSDIAMEGVFTYHQWIYAPTVLFSPLRRV